MNTIYGDYYADLALLSVIRSFGFDLKWFLQNKDRRLRECMIIKGAAQKLLYRDKAYTYQYIGNIFDRGHPTIINNIKVCDNLFDYDKSYRAKYKKAREIFLNYLADSD